MQETTRQSFWQALVIGLDPGAADALVKFWPAGVIGIGVALILGNAQG